MSTLATSIHTLLYNRIVPSMFVTEWEGGAGSDAISFFGRVLFRVSLSLKMVLSHLGIGEDRVIEYPWVCDQLRHAMSGGLLAKGALVLDVGCSESLLGHEMLAMGCQVVGLDIRDNPWRNKATPFFKESILESSLPSGKFDAAVVVSTIEHVGLSAYGQANVCEDGDLVAMVEIARVLKSKGLVFLTTPFVGAGVSAGSWFERQYDPVRLRKLMSSFDIVREDYYLPVYMGGRGSGRYGWTKSRREAADEAKIDGRFKHGLACVVLMKRTSQGWK